MFSHVGRRGYFLAIIAILQIIIGWATFIAPIRSFDTLHMAGGIGPHALGGTMMAAGAVVLINAFWPPGRDRLGFMVAFPIPLFWGLDTLITTVLGEYPAGYAGGFRGVVFWWGYAALILLVSGMVGVEEYKDRGGK